MGARGFCNVEQNESDIRPLHAKVHHLQHQAFKKNNNPSVHMFRVFHNYSITKHKSLTTFQTLKD